MKINPPHHHTIRFPRKLTPWEKRKVFDMLDQLPDDWVKHHRKTAGEELLRMAGLPWLNKFGPRSRSSKS